MMVLVLAACQPGGEGDGDRVPRSKEVKKLEKETRDLIEQTKAKQKARREGRASEEEASEEVEEGGEAALQPDAEKLQIFIDHLAEFKEAQAASDEEQLNEIARTVGFSHYASLGIYLAAVGGISMQLVYNPDVDTENLVSLYGENAVRIVSVPITWKRSRPSSTTIEDRLKGCE